jgi:glycosyltransferase involved in cell wall biosynthesis
MTPDPITVFAPAPLDARTGGYEYDRQVVRALQARGVPVELTALDASYPTPTPAARAHTTRLLASLPTDTVVLVDGLAFGAMPEEAAREAARLRLVALVHHPLAEETGLSADAAGHLRDSEVRALASARLVVVTSAATAGLLASYHVPANRIAVVEPGTHKAALAVGSAAGAADAGTLELLCVATLIPRKGHDLLVRALARLQDLPWHLTCLGNTELHPETTSAVRARIDEHQLSSRVALAGSVEASAVAQHYHRADVLVMPTYYEGYGMAIAEALAHGLPVVSTNTGAITEMVGTDAGILIPIGDLDALTEALRAVIQDAALRARLREGARRARLRLPTWDDAAAALSLALGRVTPQRTPSPGKALQT